MPKQKQLYPTGPEDKGEEIRFAGGKYHGLKGWRWKGREDTKKQAYVIVELEDGKEGGVRVKKTSVGAPFEAPKNYVEAALQQNVEVDVAMTKLCKLLAKCNLHGGEGELHQVFAEKMQAASAQQQSEQEGRGATWFKVKFPVPSKKPKRARRNV